MTAFADTTPARQDKLVSVDAIQVGKDVIELITSGMYVSPITVYREYVQNAADAIDAARLAGLLGAKTRGRVSISFDHSARAVSIRDNGSGISAARALPTLLAVGASPKRGSQSRGFRGVGRLAGLAYCRELQFVTKAAGDDTVFKLTWDCRALRERLASTSFSGDLRTIIADCVSVWHERAESTQDRFFEVRLVDIARLRNDVLLNEQMVAHYLGQVAPVPFHPDFSFAREIERHLSRYRSGLPIDLNVAEETVFRPFRDKVLFPASSHKLCVKEIEFKTFADVDGGTGAVAWIAHHEYLRSIPPTLGIRGIRARAGNLQVGDANLFDDSFKETRFNGWTVGEVHIYDGRIVPNARRDNFETNHHYYNVLVQLGPLALGISQRCRLSSVSRTAEQTVRNVIAEIETTIRRARRPDRSELSRLKSALLRARAKTKRLTDQALRLRLETKLDQLRNRLSKLTPRRGKSALALDEATSLVTKLVTNRAQARQVVEALERLCR
jgi:hypothetical protein